MHWCATADEARDAVLAICRAANARTVTKGKSMISEELGINDHLERHGITPVETDLGEYIIQLRHELPSHIIAPAFHLNKEDWEESFRKSHTDLPPDRVFHERRDILTEARTRLREKFLAADVGITGANFLIAETGSSVIVTNEGNGDLTQTLPRVHIVLASIEKMVPTIEDCTSLLRVLARSATGQDFSVYTTFSTGARRPGDLDGPDEYHVVLVDNGRSAMLGTEFQEMLRCIRCAACMNHCPVYGVVGGHAYGWVYPGPMGSVLTPSLIGVAEAGHLPNASTFCGKCESVCPVKIPLPKLMRHWREREFERHLTPPVVRTNLASWAFFARRPALYRLATRAFAWTLGMLGRRQGSFRWLPFASGWTADGTCRRPKATLSLPAMPASSAPAGSDEQGAMLAAIRRGLRRGPLPEDQAAMLRGRLALHPRHLIPARSRLPHPGQVALFVANLEKEFGSVDPGTRSGRGAGGGRHLSRCAESAHRHRDGAASGAPGDRVGHAPAAAAARGARAGIRHGEPAARIRRHRRDRHADAALGARAPDDAEPAGRHRDRAAACLAPGGRVRRGVGPVARRNGRDAAQRHAGHRPLAVGRHRADA